jgi:SAM-dependent methyltransferase
MYDKIEIIPVSLLDQHRPLVAALRRLASSLGLEIGWHYLLDLIWILDLLGPVSGKRILDAGAGMGMLQWYLAEHGAEVLSVDRDNRAFLPLHFRFRYRVAGLRATDFSSPLAVVRHQAALEPGLAGKVRRNLRDILLVGLPRRQGQVRIYNQDLRDLAEVPSGSLDAVAAVSSLEHNPPEQLEQVVAELWRVLKPGGVLLATLCASPGADWFHQPSQGWCYSEAALRRSFGLSPEVPSNYARYDQLFAQLYTCAELRDNLAAFYTRSGDNGMPWGRWDPQYQPVGVCKVKTADASPGEPPGER